MCALPRIVCMCNCVMKTQPFGAVSVASAVECAGLVATMAKVTARSAGGARLWSTTTIADASVRMLEHCGGFVGGSALHSRAEYKYWDPVRVGTDGTRRVLDVTCTDKQGKEHVIHECVLVTRSVQSDSASLQRQTSETSSMRPLHTP